MRLLRTISFLMILVGAAMLFERPAYAYADPGTGLLAVQAAGSALVATGWYLRRKIYSLFQRGGGATTKTDQSPIATKGEDTPSL